MGINAVVTSLSGRQNVEALNGTVLALSFVLQLAPTDGEWITPSGESFLAIVAPVGWAFAEATGHDGNTSGELCARPFSVFSQCARLLSQASNTCSRDYTQDTPTGQPRLPPRNDH